MHFLHPPVSAPGSRFAASFQTMICLSSAFITLRWFGLAHICVSTVVGAVKFLGVRRIFARFFQTYLKNFWDSFWWRTFLGWPPQKRSSCDSAHVGRHFFQIIVRRALFLPVFSGSLSRFSAILRRFLQISPGFSEILPRFSPNQNFWGCAYSPASCTTVC